MVIQHGTHNNEILYNLYSKISNLPLDIYIKHFADKNIIIAPKQSNWLVLSDIELEVFKTLSINKTLYETYEIIQNKLALSHEIVIDSINSVLDKIVNMEFWEDTETTIACYTKEVKLFLTDKYDIKSNVSLVDEFTTEEWIQLIDNIKDWEPTTNIILSGEEPLTHSNFTEIAHHAKKLGLTVTLETNGILFDSLEYTERMIQDVDYIDITLYGLSENIDNQFRGIDSFQKTLTALRYLKHLEREFHIVLTLFQNNVLDIITNLKAFYNLLNYEKAHIRTQIGKYHSGRRTFDEYIYLSGDQFLAYNQLILLSLQELGQNISLYNTLVPKQKVENCSINYKINVDSIGNVYTCDSCLHSIGNIRNSGFVEIIRNIEKLSETTKVDNIETCRECDLRYICGGRCRTNAYDHFKDYSKVNCYSFYKNAFYKRMLVS